MDDKGIKESFRMEMTGKGRAEALIPPCLWKKSSFEFTSTGRKYKDRALCNDFSLKGLFPATVGEVKVVMPKKSDQGNLTAFKDDLDKCEGWLMPETPFKYGLAILIDLRKGEKYSDAWNSEIISKDWPQKNIFPWRISPLSC